MENTMNMPGYVRIFKTTLIGMMLLLFGGTALAATEPSVSRLEFKDDKGTPDPSDDTVITIATGSDPYRVAVDNKGNAYITDPLENVVSMFNVNGRLIKRFGVNRNLGVAADSRKGVLYVSGYLNGRESIFILDNNNDDKDDSGNLGMGWNRQPLDMEVDSVGNVYVIDEEIKKVAPDGAVKNYGPYYERYANEVINGVSVDRTRHKMFAPQGIAVDESNGLVYVSVRELTESLGNVCAGADVNINCYSDDDSWRYYNDVLTVPTDSTYKYWNLVSTAAVKFHVLVINSNTGELIRKITTGEGDFGFRPSGLALDGKGRIYVAGKGGSSAAGGEIKVYDVDTGGALAAPGFALGLYKDVAYSPDPADPARGGRIFATMYDTAVVSVYGIDGGINPLNTAPGAPTPISPSTGSGDPVTSLPITLSMANATDNEGDPLTYGYEIRKDGSDGVVTSVFGVAEGADKKTSMSVSYSFEENQLYRWRALSFDGSLRSVWSSDAVFCVNTHNDNPTPPAVVSPVNAAQASPFGSFLSWAASTDPDCGDYVREYLVDIAGDPSFDAILSSATVAGTTVRLGDMTRKLASGSSYYWRVKAVDGNNASSEYSAGSFTYKTTVISFTSDQPDTKVYIDGNYGYRGRLLGTAPLSEENITPGSHFVTFERAEYEPYHTIINVADPILDDRAVNISAVLIKMTRIKTRASGSELLNTGSGPASPFVVDYNNDGLKDMIVGGGDGRVYLFLAEEQIQSDGTKKTVLTPSGPLKSDGSEIFVGSRAVPFMADYNNDGRKDMVLGSGGGLIYLYLNGGTENAPLFTSAGSLKDADLNYIKTEYNSAPAIVDYNNDGKKDLVLGGSDGRIRLYYNIGDDDSSPLFSSTAQVIKTMNGSDISAGSNSKVFFVDWNSDGKKDLVVGRGAPDNNTANLYLNVGPDADPQFINKSDLQLWINDRKSVRGKRDYVSYLGHNSDLGDMTGGSGEASLFVVNWDGAAGRDVIVGNGNGGVDVFINE